MKTRIARREFIKRAGMSFGFLTLGSGLIEGVLDAICRRAYAETAGTLNPSGYYIHLTLPGGPPRWYFDLPLTPMGKSSKNFKEGGFGTQLTLENGVAGTAYAVDKHVVGGKTIYLPPLWNMNLSKQKFADILPHTAFIRGVDMQINNHPLSNQQQISPIIGGYSINGVVADGGNRPVPSIVDPGSSSATAYKSKRGYSTSDISYAENSKVNPVLTLISPFEDYRAGRVVHSQDSVQFQDQALQQFESYAKAQGLTETALPKMYDNAMDLMAQNIVGLADDWSGTVAKYRGIVDEALHAKKGTLKGINDLAIKGSSSAPQFSYDSGSSNRVNLSDIRDMVTDQTTVTHMAENFTVAELLIDKVCTNFNLAFTGLLNAQSGKGNFTAVHDQHFIGSVVSTMATTLFYRAFLGCVTEFVGTLKSKGIFDRTIIHIASEFSRTPKTDLSGSDHAYMGSNATLISGMFQQVSCVGNIQTADYSSIYKGTWGVAKPYVLGGFNRPIQVNDIALSITSMLGVDTVVTNGRALYQPQGGAWVLKKEEADNV